MSSVAKRWIIFLWLASILDKYSLFPSFFIAFTSDSSVSWAKMLKPCFYNDLLELPILCKS